MAHYAYKHACYDIDYEKYKELVARFEKEQGCEHNGDSNYDGDNWYIVAMWIEELRAENAALAAALAAKDEALERCTKFTQEDYDALDLKPHAALVAKLKADAVREVAKEGFNLSDVFLLEYADRIERGEV